MLCLFLLVADVAAIQRGVSLGECRYGHATTFDYTSQGGTTSPGGNGGCNYQQWDGPIFNSEWPGLPVIAPPKNSGSKNLENWDDGIHCGECFEVSGPSGRAVFMVADSCPSFNCDEYKWDLSWIDKPFSEGRADSLISSKWQNPQFTFQKVSCGIVGNIWIVQDKLSTPGAWSGNTPINFRIGISKVEMLMNGETNWQLLTRTNGRFQATNSKAPAQIKIYSIFGDVVTGVIKSFNPGVRTELNGQFPEPGDQGFPSQCAEYIFSGVVFDQEIRTFKSGGFKIQSSPIAIDCSASPSGDNRCMEVTTEATNSIVKLTKNKNQNNPILSSWYTSFSFTVFASSEVDIKVKFKGVNGASSTSEGNKITKSWTSIKLPISEFQLAQDFRIEEIQFTTNGAGITLLFDDIHFELTSDALHSSGRVAYRNEEWDQTAQTLTSAPTSTSVSAQTSTTPTSASATPTAATPTATSSTSTSPTTTKKIPIYIPSNVTSPTLLIPASGDIISPAILISISTMSIVCSQL